MKNNKLSNNVNLGELVSKIPNNFTGADFSALTSEAYMISVKEKVYMF